ncbi:DNA-binding response OmpR family regulator [Peteryoungia aggregata LMG 23059]|uniref:DNA-binding response OmpR family regulator n=1 Tax=Peteryoungia aggregata LMG 23059 TaxID=1368425 RepID=A0ABU0GCZ4_9HYPH|nr:response regulator transcription factor [Peteryoungia aggregata]MDQ0422482.1 DNA-binding response OmpR family regulator [Peteryoungia aggregata LMG 23059]
MDMPRSSILIVEDDSEIRTLLAELLGAEGFAVAEAGNGRQMDDMLARSRADLIILDVMLPGEDGFSICRRLRAGDTVPILMLTAKGNEIDRVVGLEMGADDYLVKPFSPRELIARVRALLRRANMRSPAIIDPPRRLAFGNFIADLDARQLVDANGVQLILTNAEFDLLACFLNRPRRVLTRDQILDWIHGRSADPFDRTVDVLISRLRRKFETASPGSNLINTVRNGGYLFTGIVQQLP